MAKARQYQERVRIILARWLRGQRAAYVTLLELEGAVEQSLEDVMEQSRVAQRAAFSGGNWSREQRRLGVAGRLSTLNVVKERRGGWVVRRWVILATEATLDDSSVLSDGIRSRWEAGLARGAGVRRARVAEAHWIQSATVNGLAQLITDAYSPLDPPIEPWASNYRLQFELSETAVGPGDLAEKYRGDQQRLSEPFHAFDRTGNPVRLKGARRRFGVVAKSGGETPSLPICKIDPGAADDFIEYALALWRKDTITALKGRSNDERSALWNEFVDYGRECTRFEVFPVTKRQLRTHRKKTSSR